MDRLSRGLDDAIALLSPRWGLRRRYGRKMAELAERRMEHFAARWGDGAETDRIRGSSWLGSRLSPDSALEGNLQKWRERSNELFRTNTWVSSYVRSLVRYVVGSGRRPKASIGAKPGFASEAQAKLWNKQAQDLFRAFARKAGTRGESLRLIQRQMERARALDGEAFAILRDVDDADRVIPLAVEVISADRVATPPEDAGNPRRRLGIERDRNGKPIAIFVGQHHPHDTFDNTPVFERVPIYDAKGRRRVLHYYEQLWEGQYRGIPDAQVVINDLKDLDDLWEAQIIRQQIQACFAVFIENTIDPNDIAANSASEIDSRGRKLEEIAPGMIHRLYPGEKPTFATPSGEANLDPFMKWRLRSLAAALDFPYELLVRHWENSYSGGRLALIDGHSRFASDAALLDEQVNQPIYEQVLTEGLLTELDVPPRLFDESFSHFTACDWRGDPLPWIDPEKEVEAEAKAVALGVETLQLSLLRRGLDWDEYWQQRKEHVDALKAELNQDELVPAGWNPRLRSELQLGKEGTAGKQGATPKSVKKPQAAAA